MPTFSGYDHLAITVSDLDVSAGFYERAFGFPPVGVLEGEALHRRIFRLPSGAVLGLTKHERGADGRFSPFTPGLDHIGFGVSDRSELEAWAAHLAEVGIAFSDIVEAPYGLALSFKDPDGIALEFFVGA